MAGAPPVAPPQAPAPDPAPPLAARAPARSTTVRGVLARVLGLGLTVSLALALTPALLAARQWAGLVGVYALVAVVVAIYGTRRLVPAKYLFPGGALLALLVVLPILYTVQISTTNAGDGTRGTKEETVAQLVSSSVVQVPDSTRYQLSVGTTGSVTAGPFTFLLVDESGGLSAGDAEGRTELAAGDVTVTGGRITEADGYRVLTPREVNSAGPELAGLTVPTADGAIQRLGISTAFEGVTRLRYDAAADTLTDTATGEVYTVALIGDREYFVDAQGVRAFDQSWQRTVGLGNYARVLTDPALRGDVLGIFAWTVAFAVLSVAGTFLLGLVLAMTLNDPRLRFRRTYRSLLLLPYAIPAFISLLVWVNFYNRDFGLINGVLGTRLNWLGDPVLAKVAMVITNVWLGFPYMFVVCTGALQSLPRDLLHAAAIDGANALRAFRSVVLPLVLVAVAPLLVASFAFNFNNVNVVVLLTTGGPFEPDNPRAGATDLLISYAYRQAFGGSGAEFGFAAAISVLLFVVTAVIAAGQFRVTKSLEDIR